MLRDQPFRFAKTKDSVVLEGLYSKELRCVKTSRGCLYWTIFKKAVAHIGLVDTNDIGETLQSIYTTGMKVLVHPTITPTGNVIPLDPNT